MGERILVGSTYFFSQYDDFNSKDTDYVVLVEPNDEFKYCQEIHIPNRKCIFQVVRREAAEIIQWINEGDSPMQIGKFLVPEFNEAIGFSYENIDLLLPSIERLDEKHLYEREIYNAYKKNKAFELYRRSRNR